MNSVFDAQFRLLDNLTAIDQIRESKIAVLPFFVNAFATHRFLVLRFEFLNGIFSPYHSKPFRMFDNNLRFYRGQAIYISG